MTTRQTLLTRRLSAFSTVLSLAVSLLVSPSVHGVCTMRGVHQGDTTRVAGTGENGGGHAGHLRAAALTDQTLHSTHNAPDDKPSRSDVPCVTAGMCTPVGMMVIALVTDARAPVAPGRPSHELAIPASFLNPPDRPPPRA